MLGTHIGAAARAVRRTLPYFGLAALLISSTLGASVPALAQDTQNDPNTPVPNGIVRDHRGENTPRRGVPRTPDPEAPPPIIRDHRADQMGGEPVARVQVILKSVHIINDRDWGDGDFDFWYTLVCADEVANTCLGYNEVFLDGYGKQFSAGSGEDYTLNQTLPVDGSASPGYPATAENGYPLYPGRNYRLRFGINERDQFTNWEDMGDFRHHIRADNNWGIGTFTMRSVHSKDNSPGDFELTYEVRPMVLPDLRTVNIKVTDLPGTTKKHICTAVQNIEPGDVGYFEVALLLDGMPLSAGVASAPGVKPGDYTEVCAEPEMPTSGTHKLTAMADAQHAVLEYNEANNIYETTYTGSGAASGPTPTPGPILLTGPNAAQGNGSGQTDLIVSAVKVNGQVPDGKNDCKDGKNSVSVVVKNTGAGKAGAFAVQLAVDGGESIDAAVDGLDAGKEREVKLGEVQLKKGERKLTATVDPKNTVGESDETHNARTVTAACGDAS